MIRLLCLVNTEILTNFIDTSIPHSIANPIPSLSWLECSQVIDLVWEALNVPLVGYNMTDVNMLVVFARTERLASLPHCTVKMNEKSHHWYKIRVDIDKVVKVWTLIYIWVHASCWNHYNDVCQVDERCLVFVILKVNLLAPTETS